jgi:hypothetical protein
MLCFVITFTESEVDPAESFTATLFMLRITALVLSMYFWSSGFPSLSCVLM